MGAGSVMLDLFSGGGAGWCLAARALGLDSVGIEIDGPACATRAAAGLRTIRADVSTYPAERFAGKVVGLCGSPPCQSFSAAGKGKGLDDPRGLLVHEPLRWARAVSPRWVAMEQVPEVLGYWRAVAIDLRAMGYSTWTGILDSADFGVPQNRRRAILLASVDRRAAPPGPTHSATGQGEMFGPARKRWVTMAAALGWQGLVDTHRGQGPDGSTQTRTTDRPAPGVTAMAGTQWELHNAAAWREGPATTDQGDIPPAAAQPLGVEPWELGVLQGFPADHPWQPPYVARQIGNAIPPPLAEACLRALVG